MIVQELKALDLAGRSVSLAELAESGPVLFAFLRHFG